MKKVFSLAVIGIVIIAAVNFLQNSKFISDSDFFSITDENDLCPKKFYVDGYPNGRDKGKLLQKTIVLKQGSHKFNPADYVAIIPSDDGNADYWFCVDSSSNTLIVNHPSGIELVFADDKMIKNRTQDTIAYRLNDAVNANSASHTFTITRAEFKNSKSLIFQIWKNVNFVDGIVGIEVK